MTIEELRKAHPKEMQNLDEATDLIAKAVDLMFWAHMALSPEDGPILACKATTLTVIELAKTFWETVTNTPLDQKKDRETMT